MVWQSLHRKLLSRRASLRSKRLRPDRRESFIRPPFGDLRTGRRRRDERVGLIRTLQTKTDRGIESLPKVVVNRLLNRSNQNGDRGRGGRRHGGTRGYPGCSIVGDPRRSRSICWAIGARKGLLTKNDWGDRGFLDRKGLNLGSDGLSPILDLPYERNQTSGNPTFEILSVSRIHAINDKTRIGKLERRSPLSQKGQNKDEGNKGGKGHGRAAGSNRHRSLIPRKRKRSSLADKNQREENHEMEIPPVLKGLPAKFWVKFTALLLLTPLASKLTINETTKLADSSLWALVSLIVLITGMVRIARHQANGWLWLSFYLYASAFGHNGLVVWVYLLLSALCLWTWTSWAGTTSPKKEAETDHGMGL